MKINGKAVVKKRGKFYLGEIKNTKFKLKREINGIDDIDNPQDYKTLIEHIELMGHRCTKKLEKEILKELGYTAAYLYDKPVELTEAGTVTQKAWNEFFFGHEHHVCVQCINECKQSSRVSLQFCPNYKEME